MISFTQRRIKLLRLYFFLVLVLFFVLLCIIVSLSLFAKIIQVSLDTPPWPGTDSEAASSSCSSSLESANEEGPRPSSGKTIDDDSGLARNLIRKLAKKEEEIKFLLEQRDRIRQDLIRLRGQISLLRQDTDNNSLRKELGERTRNRNSRLNEFSKQSDQGEFAEEMFLRKTKNRDTYTHVNWDGQVRLTNEQDIVPFTRFTLSRLYLLQSGIERRVVEKPMGHRKSAVETVVDHSLARLNDKRRNPSYSREDFLEGIYRTVPGIGEQYELYFGDRELPRYNQLTVVRLMGPPTVISRRTIQIRKDIIYTIVPLSGRVAEFRKFMERFVQVAVIGDNKIYLMVVYFGRQGREEIENIVRKTSEDFHYEHMSVLSLDGRFSRGKALREGAKNCPIAGDVLMFFCDVDVILTTDFLERCRLNTERGRRVYYPIVFSLYKPSLVSYFQTASLTASPSPTITTNDTLVLSEETGFWRDFGYGMTCQYRSDFLKLNGFNETIEGWGMEDVLLYRKYVRSDLMVIRASDPGIFHLWHEKTCDVSLPVEQYRGCIRSKALNEASHAQLGMLSFKAEIESYKTLTNRTK